jgi:hypothetical protein
MYAKVPFPINSNSFPKRLKLAIEKIQNQGKPKPPSFTPDGNPTNQARNKNTV